MRRNTWHVFAAVALAGLFATTARADDKKRAVRPAAYSNSYLESEVADLRSEIDDLRVELDNSLDGAYDEDGKGGCGCCQPKGTYGCFEPCCHSSGLWAEAELTYFQYNRADGTRVGVGVGEDVDTDYEASARVAIGYVGSDGLGVRVRWWDYDHSWADTDAAGQVNVLAVDTYTIDFEVFDTFCLNRNWDLEIAFGVRYNEFREVMIDNNETRFNDFSGIGGVVSAELRRAVGCNGALYVRVRGAMLMDDKDIFNNNSAPSFVRLNEVTQGMFELAMGYEYNQCLGYGAVAYARAGYEWQNWYNYSSAFEDTLQNEDFGGPSDVGFHGFTFSLGVRR